MPNDKRTIVFDLETIADKSVIQFLPEIEQNKGMTDPVKIKNDIAKKEAQQLEKMGVNPPTLMICCFGFWYDGKADYFMLENEQSEKDLLSKAWDLLALFNHFVTFNGNTFDVPALYFRSLKHKVRPSVQIKTNKYKIENHVDVRTVLTSGDTYAKGKLPFWYRIATGKALGPDIEGSEVQQYWDNKRHTEIANHCMQDCKMTAELYKLIKSYYLI